MDITAKLQGGLEKFINNISNNAKLEVGFFDHRNATVAAKNEFGNPAEKVDSNTRFGQWLAKYNLQEVAIGTPPRPFMKITFDDFHKKWSKTIKSNFLKKFNSKDALNINGKEMVENMQETILYYHWQPNSSLVVPYKNDVIGTHHQPLIDTEEMFNSIKYEIK